MDPISLVIEFEIATLLLAVVGSVATWFTHKNQQRTHKERERQHQEMKALHERHHRERMAECETKKVHH